MCRINPLTTIHLSTVECPKGLDQSTSASVEMATTPQRPGLSRLCTGYEAAHGSLRNAILTKFLYPEYTQRFNVDLPKGILLSSSEVDDCDLLVDSMVKDMQTVTTCTKRVVPPEEVTTDSGSSTQLNLYELLHQSRSSSDVSVVYLKNMQQWCPHRAGAGNWHQRSEVQSGKDLSRVATLLTLMDKGGKPDVGGKILFVASVPSFQEVDSALRRPGRFEYEVVVETPDAGSRFRILEQFLNRHHLSSSLEEALRCIKTRLPQCEEETAGIVDTEHLQRWLNEFLIAVHSFHEDSSTTLGSNSVRRLIQLLHRLAGVSYATLRDLVSDALLNSITSDRNEIDFTDLEKSLPLAPERSGKEFSPVEWNSVGGIPYAKKRLKEAVEWPMKYGSYYNMLGLSPPRGVLLFGPPGCSKTMLVRAAATSLKATFISLSGADILSPYVGEAERKLR